MKVFSVVWFFILPVLAFAISIWHYYWKERQKPLYLWMLISLRALAYLALMLLLVNPQFTKTTYELEKPALALVFDNSVSISNLHMERVLDSIAALWKLDNDLNERFDIARYSFGRQLYPLADSLSHQEGSSRIDVALNTLEKTYDRPYATVLFTDGNQTQGYDYEYVSHAEGNPIYSVVFGDTTTYDDLRITQINVNRYTYLKNSFPVEIMLAYDGSEPITTTLSVQVGGKTQKTKQIMLGPDKTTTTEILELEAKEVGVVRLIASVPTLKNEQNKANNSRQLAIEVIDQRIRVGVVSSFPHPDLGALRNSIANTDLRQIDLIAPLDALKRMEEFDLFVLYQPDPSFDALMEAIKKERKDYFLVVGLQTDWNFLNKAQTRILKKQSLTSENIQPLFNSDFHSFQVEDIGFGDFPPLQFSFGEIQVLAPAEAVLYQRIGKINTDYPLLLVIEDEFGRSIVLLGENLWRWRAKVYRDQQNFSQFDEFIGKMIQFLSGKKERSRLVVDHPSFFDGNTPMIMKAWLFDSNYIFDGRSTIELNLQEKNTENRRQYTFLLRNDHYEVDLSDIPPGEYSYTVIDQRENIQRSGSILVLPFDLESQFSNAKADKLQRLSASSGGQTYFPSNERELRDFLNNDMRFAPIQRPVVEKRSLIEWYWLVAGILILLSVEWLTRKYLGMV